MFGRRTLNQYFDGSVCRNERLKHILLWTRQSDIKQEVQAIAQKYFEATTLLLDEENAKKQDKNGN